MRTVFQALLSGAMVANGANAQSANFGETDKADGLLGAGGDNKVVVEAGEVSVTEEVKDVPYNWTDHLTYTQPVTVGYHWDFTTFNNNSDNNHNKWVAEFTQEMKALMDGLNTGIAAKRLELEEAIKTKEEFLAYVQANEGQVDMKQLIPINNRISSAKDSLNQAEGDFEGVFNASKKEFSQLQAKSTSALEQWEASKAALLVAEAESAASFAAYEELKNDVAKEEAEIKLIELKNARAKAEALRLKYESAWARVVQFTAKMKAQLIQARTILFREWSSAVQALRISTEASNKFQLDLVYQAQAVVQEGLRQQALLLAARKEADGAVSSADAQVVIALEALAQLRLQGAALSATESARLASLDLQAQQTAATLAFDLITSETELQAQKLSEAEAMYKLAEIEAKKMQESVFEDQMSRASLQLDAAKLAASSALAIMQAEVTKKQSVGFTMGSSTERDSIQLKIVMLAKQADEAAARLKLAGENAAAAEAKWALRMKEIRRDVIVTQELTRKTIMLKITQGQEAAQIQAEAAAQAKFLRERIYQQALSKANLATAGVHIQESAMKQAYELVSGQGYEADKIDQLQNASMSKSMWTEAYNKYSSSAAATQSQDSKRAALATAKAALLKFNAEVSALELSRDSIKAKLSAATLFVETKAGMLDIQTEALTRLQIAEQTKRAEAEKEARRRAEDLTSLIQERALMRAKERSDSLLKISMELTSINASSVSLQAEAQAAQLKQAKLEAEMIQAEAKARARVDGEASILTSAAMKAATAAYEATVRAESELKLKMAATSAQMKLVTDQRLAMMAKLDANTAKLDLSISASNKSDQQWRIDAQQRAANMAAKIQLEAENRSRARWQAKRFQILALSEAKKRAKLIEAEATKESTMTFYSEPNLYMPKFETKAEELQWLILQQDKKIRHERLVKASDSWLTQVANLRQIQAEATVNLQAVAGYAVKKIAAQMELDDATRRVEELESQILTEEGETELANTRVEVESAALAVKLVSNAEKQAIVTSRASQQAATIQGKAWCMAKQKTEDAEWDALTQKAVLTKSGAIVRVRTIYDQNNWEACLLQP